MVIVTRRMSAAVKMDAQQFALNLLTALKDADIKKELSAIVESGLRQELDTLRERLQEKDRVIAGLTQRVDSQEEQVDALEQYSRRNSLRVSGLDEKMHEDPMEEALKFINVELKVTPPLSYSDLDRAHRVGKQEDNAAKPRPMLIKFATYRARHAVYSRRSSLKDVSKPVHKAIFINEDLTRVRGKQMYELRKLKKNGKIKDLWSHDGNIIVKDNHNHIQTVRSRQKLSEIMRS